jgi:hypothetical protein
MPKRSLLTIPFLALLALALAATAPAQGAARQAGQAKTHHCRNTYYAPLYTKITKITERGARCGTARKLTYTYMRAVSSSSGAVNFTGHCFGAHSYGPCTVHYRGRAWHCYHFDAVPARTRGLVRCTHDQQLVKFNIGT